MNLSELKYLISESIERRLNESYDEFDGYYEGLTYRAVCFYNQESGEIVNDSRKMNTSGSWYEIHLVATNTTGVDRGIGQYEFWGQSGYDSQPDAEIDEFEVEDYEFYDYIPFKDEDGPDDGQLSQEDINNIESCDPNDFEWEAM